MCFECFQPVSSLPTQEGAGSSKGERFVLGPRPKLVVGAGEAPGFAFELVTFDLKKGREKALAMGAMSQVRDMCSDFRVCPVPAER